MNLFYNSPHYISIRKSNTKSVRVDLYEFNRHKKQLLDYNRYKTFYSKYGIDISK